MNWYKRAQHKGHDSHYQDSGLEGNDGFYDLHEAVDDHRSSLLDDYYSEGREPNSMMSWSVVPFGRLRKIWEDYARYHVIHDEAGLFKIRDQFLDTLARLQAATDLGGHSTWSMEDIAERYEFPAVPDDDSDFYLHYLETPYGTPISDYAMDPLWRLANELMGLKGDPVATLVILDRMLNVIHCRGDIASLFVEGGSESLDQLFGRPCGLNRYDEEA